MVAKNPSRQRSRKSIDEELDYYFEVEFEIAIPQGEGSMALDRRLPAAGLGALATLCDELDNIYTQIIQETARTYRQGKEKRTHNECTYLDCPHRNLITACALTENGAYKRCHHFPRGH